jgi:hypothetical protein
MRALCTFCDILRAAQFRSEESRWTPRNERASHQPRECVMQIMIVFQMHCRERTDSTVQVVNLGTLAQIHGLPIVLGEVFGNLACAKVGLLSCL